MFFILYHLQLENLAKEDLIKYVKRQAMQLQKVKAQCDSKSLILFEETIHACCRNSNPVSHSKLQIALQVTNILRTSFQDSAIQPYLQNLGPECPTIIDQ